MFHKNPPLFDEIAPIRRQFSAESCPPRAARRFYIDAGGPYRRGIAAFFKGFSAAFCVKKYTFLRKNILKFFKPFAILSLKYKVKSRVFQTDPLCVKKYTFLRRGIFDSKAAEPSSAAVLIKRESVIPRFLFYMLFVKWRRQRGKDVRIPSAAPAASCYPGICSSAHLTAARRARILTAV